MALESRIRNLFLTISLSTSIVLGCNEVDYLTKNKDPPLKPILIERCVDEDNDGKYSLENCGTKVDECDNNPYLQKPNIFFEDNDNDTYGSKLPYKSCTWFAPPGYSANYQDCDDTKPNVNPGKLDICDGLDNDCNTNTIDGYHGPETLNTLQLGVCKNSNKSCVDGILRDDYSNIPNFEFMETICDKKDNDCDGDKDETCGKGIIVNLFHHESNTSSLITMSWDSSNERTVTQSTSTKFSDPSWSPLENSIVYSKSNNPQFGSFLEVYDLETGRTTIITRNTDRYPAKTAEQPTWCVSGKIIYVRNFNLWTVDPILGQDSELPLTPLSIFGYRKKLFRPDCSPDGSKIVSTYIVPDVNQNNSRFFLHITDVDGTNTQVLTNYWPFQRSHYNQASWIDNQYLIISSDVEGISGNNELYELDSDLNLSKEERLENLLQNGRLTIDPSTAGQPIEVTFDDINPCTSKSGEYSAFISKRTGTWQLYRMRMYDKKITQLTSGEGEVKSIDCD